MLMANICNSLRNCFLVLALCEPVVAQTPTLILQQADAEIDDNPPSSAVSVVLSGSNFTLGQLAIKGGSVRDNAPSSGPVSGLKGCVYQSGSHKYQAAEFDMNKAGLIAYNAILYHGLSCNPNQFFDQFGFGSKVRLGPGHYIFWFDHHPNKLDTSGLWTVGNEQSNCVDYKTSPAC